MILTSTFLLLLHDLKYVVMTNCLKYSTTKSEIVLHSATAYADNVAVPAFACHCCSNWLIFPASWAHSTKPAAVVHGGWTGQTDRWMPDSCIDPAPHTMQAVPIKRLCRTLYLIAASTVAWVHANKATICMTKCVDTKWVLPQHAEWYVFPTWHPVAKSSNNCQYTVLHINVSNWLLTSIHKTVVNV